MNTIPSKYHSQIRKLIKKARAEAKAEGMREGVIFALSKTSSIKQSLLKELK